ncbi:Abortive infection bacteriophage resistance protein [Azotobacter beijerinckii]|uniref:Abortive infection bacteriophage resistance protein n=1 Tax=Azotobacter beijerinckii TaxID=170623 RepID=A0A1H9R2S8_9GAMM|nr:Abi family protein [Azotobacter beijerinckii]SER66283.1 Abortive infection bacteriophage resistance protein [Azotobacter beijerinckii]
MAYNRPWKSFADQLELLKSRGMSVTDEAAALSYLERIGYYRLSAYWYPFRVFKVAQDPATRALSTVRTDRFEADTQFVGAVELYLFDKKLRLQVMDALERIEIALRVDIAYLLGAHDTFAYLTANSLHPSFANKIGKRTKKSAFDTWQEKYSSLLARSKEDFVKHYRANHGPDLPIWVAVEVWDFGAVSQLLAMMKVADQQRIAAKYGVSDWKVFQSWVRSLSYLRNLAAHHSRLWNRNVTDQPSLPRQGEIAWCDDFIGKADLIAKPFLLLAIARHLVKVVCPHSEWHVRLKKHLEAFPQQHSRRKLSIADMGVPAGWESWWI